MWGSGAGTMSNGTDCDDPTGGETLQADPSTHIDANGKVITVYDDGDLGVYQHPNNADGRAPTKAQLDKRHKKSTSAGGTRVGETMFWDEFISPETGRPMTNYTVYPNGSFDPTISQAAQQAANMDLAQRAHEMRANGQFDIKRKLWPNVAMKLNGYIVTSRSAGNYLAGYLAESGTYLGVHISPDTFQKMAGYQQVMEDARKPVSKWDLAGIVINGTSYGAAPYYGENYYQYRMSKLGWDTAADGH